MTEEGECEIGVRFLDDEPIPFVVEQTWGRALVAATKHMEAYADGKSAEGDDDDRDDA